jgi:ABC-type Mn2+/Zn2+ transport system ATPase subunit
MVDRDASFRGAQPSIVESFKVEGLYGYRTISLSSEYAATILIAKNGAGKTTLLAALDAFLKCQFSRLRDVKFLRLCCKLRGVDNEICLSRDDVLAYGELKPGNLLEREARRFEVEPAALLAFVENISYDDEFGLEEEVAQKIVAKLGYNRQNAQAACQKIVESFAENAPAVEAAIKLIKAALRDTEVVYLPTYRRIELSMSKSDRTDRAGRPRKFFPATKSGLYAGEIQFGLTDILERLASLNSRIVLESSFGYRELSASIINELIDGTFDKVSPTSADIPDQEELALFFSRLKDPRGYGPYIDVSSIPNMEKIYTGQDISDERNKFLRYFLAKLNTVIQATRNVETLVRDFIENCNKYLSFQDASTSLEKTDILPLEEGNDDKVLRLSRKDLRVYVESVHGGRTIPLDALSSGEKQMISLFAKLYLYPKNKILLIDEPELSLSIDWQREILVDAMNAPLCRQVIAITHSPFIFDNVLEPFARPLRSAIDPREGVLPEDIEDDLHG